MRKDRENQMIEIANKQIKKNTSSASNFTSCPLSVCLSASLSICLLSCLSVRLAICLSVCPSVSFSYFSHSRGDASTLLTLILPNLQQSQLSLPPPHLYPPALVQPVIYTYFLPSVFSTHFPYSFLHSFPSLLFLFSFTGNFSLIPSFLPSLLLSSLCLSLSYHFPLL